MDNQNCLGEALISFGVKVKDAVVEAKDNIVISGDFCGKIISSAKVTIHEGAHVTGQISCKDFDCYGIYSGRLDVSNMATFHSNCVVDGKMKVGHFSADDGAKISSVLKVLGNHSASVGQKPATPAAASNK